MWQAAPDIEGEDKQHIRMSVSRDGEEGHKTDDDDDDDTNGGGGKGCARECIGGDDAQG